jgi:GntR family transcriptional repressor for pyruvate dehydrogenase complex
VRKEHRAIFDAVQARDPAAARLAALGHLLQAERRLQQGGLLQAPRGAVSRALARTSLST